MTHPYIEEILAATGGPTRLYAGNEWLDATGGSIPSVNPATEELICEIGVASAADVDRVVEAAQEGARTWRDTPWNERMAKINALADRLVEVADGMAMTDTIESGLPINGMKGDAVNCAKELRYFAGISGEAKGETYPDTKDLFASTILEPFGVVARIDVADDGYALLGAADSSSDEPIQFWKTVGDDWYGLVELGATVDEISIPMHRAGPAIWTPIAIEGLTNQMMKGNGMGTGWKGLYTTSLLDYHANWRSRADELSDSLKICMFIGQYFLKHHRGHYYAKSQNLSRKLRDAYNALLSSYDILLMPTTPMKATPLPPPDASLALYCQRAFEMIPNTAPFDVTGHPAMSIPCGMIDGLPVGMMLIGRHYDESTIYRAAAAFEQSGDWKRM